MLGTCAVQLYFEQQLAAVEGVLVLARRLRTLGVGCPLRTVCQALVVYFEWSAWSTYIT